MVAKHPGVLAYSVAAKLRPALQAIASLARLDPPALARGPPPCPTPRIDPGRIKRTRAVALYMPHTAYRPMPPGPHTTCRGLPPCKPARPPCPHAARPPGRRAAKPGRHTRCRRDPPALARGDESLSPRANIAYQKRGSVEYTLSQVMKASHHVAVPALYRLHPAKPIAACRLGSVWPASSQAWIDTA
jgi:hypothetical protein